MGQISSLDVAVVKSELEDILLFSSCSLNYSKMIN